MADYYPLLAKAVAGLPQSNAEQRRAIYERARRALLAQLRAIAPPILDSDIERETHALDAAIAVIEGEIAAQAARAAAAETSAPAAETSSPAAEGGVAALDPRPRAANAAHPTHPAPPVRRRSEPANPPKLRPSLPAREDRDSDPPSPAHSHAGNRVENEAEIDAFAATTPHVRKSGRSNAAMANFRISENRRWWIFGGIAAAAILLIAMAAIALRESHGDAPLAKAAQTDGADPAQAKIGGRANGEADASGQRDAQANNSKSNETLPVAHRAVLFIQTPEDKDNLRAYMGEVVWRLENVAPGPGQPLSAQIRADVKIPEVGMSVTLDMQKNHDPALGASHTLEVRFTTTPGSAAPGVKQIGAPLVRRETATVGDPLFSLPAKITDAFYLIALARGDMERRNIEFLRTRGWVDVPILLKNDRAAKLSLEKGLSGERIFNDAFTAWDAEK